MPTIDVACTNSSAAYEALLGREELRPFHLTVLLGNLDALGELIPAAVGAGYSEEELSRELVAHYGGRAGLQPPNWQEFVFAMEQHGGHADELVRRVTGVARMMATTRMEEGG